ncbi:hypothetical protein M422DRAFT_29767 [Sphaerobolus stellatus SS14]|uniref:Uncharacterized protein n=1 Tax=Sphaerobolus stellatus (strain SS14) TaxID=990650 RepID=A0A0C9VF91_SPHS4|nr:hypothetical protein M422DRAFT_29767 [Sphaerobolus stellatus SS14]
MFHVESNLRIVRQVLNITRLQIRGKHSGYIQLPKFKYYQHAAMSLKRPRGLDAWAWERSNMFIRQSALPSQFKDVLYTVQKLVGQKLNSSALNLFLQTLSQTLHGSQRPAAYELAISLFTHSDDLHSAITLLEAMSKYRMPVHVTTLMRVFRLAYDQSASYHSIPLEQIRNSFLGALSKLDEGEFRDILTYLFGHDSRELVFALETYKALKPEWIPPPPVYSMVIQAFNERKDADNARIWLDKYRESRRKVTLSQSSAATPTKTEIGDSVTPMTGPLERPPRWGDPQDNYECSPYTSYVIGLRNLSEAQVDKLESVLGQIEEDNVEIDIKFYNGVLRVYSRWKLFPQAVAYIVMVRSKSYVFPDADTYGTIFLVLRRSISETKHGYIVTNHRGLRLRTVFSEMITLDAVRTSTVTTKIPHRIIGTTALFYALQAFMEARDYSAALVALRFLKKYDYFVSYRSRSQESWSELMLQVEQRVIAKLSHRLYRIDQKAWASRFLGYRRPSKIDKSDGAVTLILKTIQGLETQDVFARIEEFLTRALLAEMSISAPQRSIAVRGNEKAEAEIAKAMAEMAPSEEGVDKMRERIRKLTERGSTVTSDNKD